VLLARDLQAFNYIVRQRTNRLSEVDTVVHGDERKIKGVAPLPRGATPSPVLLSKPIEIGD
jgi:hypothetical protein